MIKQNEEKSREYFSLWMNVGNADPWIEVLYHAKKSFLKEGETILGDGEIVDGFYLLLSGLLRFVSFDANGQEAILFYVTERNLIGDSSYFNKMPVYGFFSAIEDATLYYFSRSVLEKEVFPKHPELMKNLLEYMAYKIGVLLHHQCEVVSDDIMGKVCRIIFDISKYNDYRKIVISKITQQEMATALSLHRSTFSKIIQKLRSLNVLEWRGRREIIIYDYDKLHDLAHNVFAI